MASPSELCRLVSRFESLPTGLRLGIIAFILGKKIPFIATAKLKIQELSDKRVAISIQSRRRVQNHLKGIHAVAMALLAETTTGLAIGMHLPDDKIPLLKTLKIDYLRRPRGDLAAIAELSPVQMEDVLSLTRGEISVPVIITDQTGAMPIQCELIWAWIPRKGNRAGSPRLE